MSKEEISRKKRVRGAHRTSVKRLISITDDFPKTTEFVPKLEASVITLQEKETVLRDMNIDLLALVSEDDIEEEIGLADEYSGLIRTAIASIKASLVQLAISASNSKTPNNDEGLGLHDTSIHTTDDQSNHSNSNRPRSTTNSHLKLPKLTLKEFDGQVNQWSSFWDAFEATIHNHPQLPDIDKFNYLNSLLKGDAAQAINGLSLTSENYHEAIEILCKRFGNKQAIITEHMETLMNIEVKDSGKNIRKLYDSVEAQVRALKSLGVPSSSYGCMLTSIILSKLPADIRLTMSRELKGDDWQFDKLMELLCQEVEAQERASIHTHKSFSTNVSSSKHPQPYKYGKMGTATALLTTNFNPGTTKPTCTYCRQPHASNSCRNVTNIGARKDILRRFKKCFVCLRKDHFGRNCDAKTCYKCNGRHHISLCPQIHPYGTQSQQENSQSWNGNQQYNGANCRYQNNPHSNNSNQQSYNVINQEPQNNNQLRGDNQHYQSAQSKQDQTKNGATVLYVESTTPVLLQTAECVVFSPNQCYKKAKIRLILDCGSQRTYLSARVREFLQLPTVDQKDIIIKTFGSTEESTKTVDVVYVNMHSSYGDIQLSAFVVPLICDPLTFQPISQAKRYFPHLSEFEFADSSNMESGIEIDMLIGADQYWSLITGGIIRGENGPSAICTKLGWVLSGPLHTDDIDPHQNTNLITTHVLKCESQLSEVLNPVIQNSELENCLHKFWDLESLGIKPRSIYEDLSDSICFKEGRYEVKLPWKIPHPFLPDNYRTSLKRFSSLMKRLQGEPEVLCQYNQVIEDQLKNGILELVDENDSGEVGKTHYLPHHGVIRTDKDTTKLRIVYDASSKDQGPSLNDCLFIGPPLTHNILDILLRFRVNRIALTGDIEKAFLMVSIAPEDRDVLRFLWVKNIYDENAPLITLRFARVAFGVSSSPFLLNATIKYHLEQYSVDDPQFVHKILSSIYVDDLSLGENDIDSAYELYLKSKTTLAEAGFNLRKFVTNSFELNEKIKSNESQIEQSKPEAKHQVVSDDESYAKLFLGGTDSIKEEQKILGVRWNFISDLFCFNLSEISDLAKECLPTKRNIVSLASKIFDPFGYLSPVTIQIKVLFQQLCKSDCDWDTELKGDNLDSWHKLVESLQVKTSYFLPRCLFYGVSETVLHCSLHGFCDASMKAYGAVIYLRIVTCTNAYVRFLVAKTRVSPISNHTIPRLELLSGLVLARLIDCVNRALSDNIDIQKYYCWTDSKVALHWIKGENREYKQFVQNRISEIRTLTHIDCWGHVSGKCNPADILSRGISPFELSTSDLWQNGPNWLSDFEDNLDSYRDPGGMPEECLSEMKIKDRENFIDTTTLLSTGDTVIPTISQVIQCKNFSSYKRLIRVTAFVKKFVNILKAKVCGSDVPQSDLKPCDIQEAESLWLKDIQSELSNNRKFIQWKREFNLVTNEDGIIYCHGRFSNADMPISSKYPILLDSNHHVASLLVKDCHIRVMHGGVKSTLTELRSKFWLIRGRQFVRKLIYQCVTCRKFEGKPYPVLAAPPLPSFRVNESPPFSYTGVDFAGPLFVKNNNQDSSKVWIALFTCCCTRAVHLDLMPDLTTETFIRCFKRFVARFGNPVKVISDNAKTFGSASEYLKLFSDNSPVRHYFVIHRIDWSFNLEKAPWWGGIFERLIKSTKRCLKKTIGNAKLSYDELLTVVVEIETILNCRPLSYVSSEDFEEPLTPSHLLYGRRLLGFPESEPSDLDEDFNPERPSLLRKRHFHMNMVLSHFWSRWKSEYLLELRNSHRTSSSQTTNIVSIGDIVIVNDEHQPRTLWKLGKVEKLITGTDGLSRGAFVRPSKNESSHQLKMKMICALILVGFACVNAVPVPPQDSTTVADNLKQLITKLSTNTTTDTTEAGKEFQSKAIYTYPQPTYAYPTPTNYVNREYVNYDGTPYTGFPPTTTTGIVNPTTGGYTTGYTAYPYATGYPTTGYPTTGYPTTGYPTTGYPATGYPTTGYPTDPYAAAAANPYGYNPYAAPSPYGYSPYPPNPYYGGGSHYGGHYGSHSHF